ncbi:hypothetical protein HYU15_01830 [Candidatus Woesearchaeota archaeon]|nr:hypothetical protein [Candidatus Woesearchaeota archaeon]
MPEHDGEPFNIGNEKPEITMKQLAEAIAELFEEEVQLESAEGLNDAYSKGDPKRRCPDITKAKTLLGYEPKVGLKTGLRRFMEWVSETTPGMPALKKN